MTLEETTTLRLKIKAWEEELRTADFMRACEIKDEIRDAKKLLGEVQEARFSQENDCESCSG